MFTVAFYSFRGGVGRTMAVANVAYQLALKRQNVFVIDFDLEAPGLSFMPEFQPGGKGPKSPIGLAGFLEAGIREEPIPQVEDLCYVPRIARRKEVRGEIHVLSSGDLAEGGKTYDVGRLHLDRLYDDKRRAVVIDDLREQIADEFKPDYLLVDSRTGLTEIGGICTTHLAEFVVILFGLNEQNVVGTALVLQRLRKATREIAGRCLLVASPVPVGEEALKAKRLKAAKGALAAALEVDPKALPDLLTIPYHPQLALSEESFVAHHPDTELSSAYRELASGIRARNPRDAHVKFEQAVDILPADLPRAMKLLREACELPQAPPEALGLYALLLDATGSFGEAEEHYRRAIDMDPQDANNLGSFALFLKRRERSGEAEEYYRRAIEANPKDANNLGNYATFLMACGPFDEAEEYYRRAIEVDPDHANNLGNYAVFLKQRERFGEAEEHYRRAIEVDPDHANNLGNFAAFLAERERLNEAEDYYRRAIEADPKHANNLGNFALFLTRAERCDEAEEYYRRAIEADPKHAKNLGNYGWYLYEAHGDVAGALDQTEKALKIDPQAPLALLNRGLFLLLLGKQDEAKSQYEAALAGAKTTEDALKAGLNDLREAAGKHPDDEAISDMLAWLEDKVKVS